MQVKVCHTLFGKSSVVMTNGKAMIPIDAMKITSERLTTGIHDRLLMSLPVDFRYEYVANTKRKTEAPKHDVIIRI